MDNLCSVAVIVIEPAVVVNVVAVVVDVEPA